MYQREPFFTHTSFGDSDVHVSILKTILHANDTFCIWQVKVILSKQNYLLDIIVIYIDKMQM